MPILIVSDAESSASWSRPLTVLLVDDSPVIGEAVRRTLKGIPDLAYHFCSEGPRALQVAVELAPAVILLDLVMPDVDGLDLVVRFREEERTRNVPLVVLSAQEEPEIKAEAFRRGANDYIVKLPSEVELVARIRYHAQAHLNAERGRAAHAALRESQELLRQRNEEIQRQLDTVARQARALEAQNEFIRDRFGGEIREAANGGSPLAATVPRDGESVRVAILAAGFGSTPADSLPPGQLGRWLSRYLETVTREIASHGGRLLDDLGADRATGLFGAPSSEAAAVRALHCGLSTRRAIDEVNERHEAAGLPRLDVSLALHTGTVVVATLGGGADRTRAVAIGIPLRLAHRLASFARAGQLLASANALEEARAGGARVDALEVAGLGADGDAEALAAYEVVTGAGERSGTRNGGPTHTRAE